MWQGIPPHPSASGAWISPSEPSAAAFRWPVPGPGDLIGRAVGHRPKLGGRFRVLGQVALDVLDDPLPARGGAVGVPIEMRPCSEPHQSNRHRPPMVEVPDRSADEGGPFDVLMQQPGKPFVITPVERLRRSGPAPADRRPGSTSRSPPIRRSVRCQQQVPETSRVRPVRRRSPR